ncbi:hypothetical protein GCM10010329_31810 [Streptomyces spiroverticillatus]|uniref:DUF2867 domain-containing protein n=1 Tax=Streptomyces finlayi TaxID=67296 RepID=A0A919C9P0_9ACTN|nr:DUF2867 domain-containing protein [Streptomyces finlayi]GHA06860.1 hypothetical protein GCM10010329_31810 [Streptomyces spiroverticillatus]GHC90319.1 hypothetical protein GCM10010334_24220 [Streptomyces finlayi]
MKLPRTSHTELPWRIHGIAPDFDVEDVWSFRTPGAGPDDFPVMLRAMREGGRLDQQPAAARFLFAVRWKLGALLGWDKERAGLGGRVRPLRDRLPEELRATTEGVEKQGPFSPVFQLPDECVLELANGTVHTLMHLGWVPAVVGTGDHELRMAVLVKPNGRFGKLYMGFIAPFRYAVVYPALTRMWEGAWRDRERLHTGTDGTTGQQR